MDRKFDEVYQFAADMGGAGFVFTGNNDADIMHNSAMINLNMLDACSKRNVKRIFYSSSACIYPEYNQMEPFRPFAPSILLERVGEYFERDYPDPFMIKVYPIRPEKRAEIPAVTHLDGTGRLQTVSREDNPLYWQLIKEFENLIGVPVVLNTSFNENESIVCTPEEALDCFLRTKMDVLVLGPYMIIRT